MNATLQKSDFCLASVLNTNGAKFKFRFSSQIEELNLITFQLR